MDNVVLEEENGPRQYKVDAANESLRLVSQILEKKVSLFHRSAKWFPIQSVSGHTVSHSSL